MKELTTRERIALYCGGGAVLIALLYAGVITPYRAALQRLDSRIESRQQQLATMQGQRPEYQRLVQEATRTERRLAKSDGFTLVPFLENLVATTAGRENLVYLRPQPGIPPAGYREETLELKLEKVRLEQLVRLLHGIDSAEACVMARNLKMKPRFEDKSLLDVVLTISVYGVQR